MKVFRRVPSLYPEGIPPLPMCLFEADVGINVPVGQLIGQWDDQSGNARHMTAAGAARPTFRVEDDQLPYVECSTGAEFMFFTGMPAYVGTALSLYLVARPYTFISLAASKICSLGRAAVVPGTGAGTFCIQKNGGNLVQEFRRDAISQQVYSTPGGVGQMLGDWYLFSMRTGSVRSGVHPLTRYQTNSLPWNVDSNPAWNFTGFSVGAGISNVLDGNPAICDIRHFSVFPTMHDDATYKNFLRRLAHKWNVPGVLD